MKVGSRGCLNYSASFGCIFKPIEPSNPGNPCGAGAAAENGERTAAIAIELRHAMAVKPAPYVTRCRGPAGGSVPRLFPFCLGGGGVGGGGSEVSISRGGGLVLLYLALVGLHSKRECRCFGCSRDPRATDRIGPEFGSTQLKQSAPCP